MGAKEVESIKDWLRQRAAVRLGQVIETMTGAAIHVRAEAGLEEDVAPGNQGENPLIWRQKLSLGDGGAEMLASRPAWYGVGDEALKAVGIDDGDEDSIKGTWLEILGQAISGIAQDLSGRVGSEVTTSGGEEVTELGSDLLVCKLVIDLPSGSVEMFACLPNALPQMVASIEAGEMAAPSVAPAAAPKANAAAASAAPSAPSGVPAAPVASAPMMAVAPGNLDLLLDVELPVTVSFGRAQVPLKDVLKLTSGSVVELNRSVVEPVEIIVNNCVIARGEVVVLEGNYGVRIQQIVSRQERLRTLN
jgi:flagellar motor switch protein FliN